MSLSINRFDEFFRALYQDKHGKPLDPFPWQSRLAKQVFKQGWPQCIDLPTASGKTACIDIAVFVLACQATVETNKRTVGRRIFFTVNRRVIVDDAFDRSFKIADRLLNAKSGILREVADALHEISGYKAAPPLDVAQLRGGISRDSAWVRSITQPIIVCTTADQLGSRLLFRGYGVSPSMQPIHAALTACDSLILLDEAHVTRAFCQTLGLLTKYQNVRNDASDRIPPMRFVQMTATPVDAPERFELDEVDRSTPLIDARQTAPKSVELIKLKAAKPIVAEIVSRAFDALSDTRKAVGIIVNRVQTARDIEQAIRDEIERRAKKDGSFTAEVHLIIGRMRPIDRDHLQAKLRNLVGPERPDLFPEDAKPVFVVATQCLEVGADYDFDAMITECASIDALRQRFGRLNRKGRPIEIAAAIITNDAALKDEDPIYGKALKNTWDWLNENNRPSVDFGILAFKRLWDDLDDTKRQAMLAPAPDAAVLLPAHLDALCQTSPQPEPSPDVSYFIHGPQRDMTEVNVCWRADLGADQNLWPEIVRLLPPTSPECMTVPLRDVRRWMAGAPSKNNRDADVPVASENDESKQNQQDAERSIRRVLAWRGSADCVVVESPSDLRPGDTIVIRTQDFGWEALGHIPKAPTQACFEELRRKTDEASVKARQELEHRRDLNDVAEQATSQARLRVVRRIHPVFPNSGNLRGRSGRELRQALIDQDVIPAEWNEAPVARLERHQYPESSEDADELIVFKRLLDPPNRLAVPASDEDDGADNLSELLLDRHKPGRPERAAEQNSTDLTPPSLAEHTQHVIDRTKAAIDKFALNGLAQTVCESARFHDLGKSDIRFQAMLAGITPHEAMMRLTLLAKGDGERRTVAEKRAIRTRAMLPDGFRHEMLSVEILEHCYRDLITHGASDPDDLLLHLIATHHGHARPFAPVVRDDPADDQLLTIESDGLTINPQQRKAWTPSHRLDSGIAERFWKLTRTHGWWGLAWLESILRLADQQASAAEQQGMTQ